MKDCFYCKKAKRFNLNYCRCGKKLTNKKVHKRMDTKETIVGSKARCGLMEFYINNKNLNWRWNKVTCKNCLNKKIKGEK